MEERHFFKYRNLESALAEIPRVFGMSKVDDLFRRPLDSSGENWHYRQGNAYIDIFFKPDIQEAEVHTNLYLTKTPLEIIVCHLLELEEERSVIYEL